VPDPNCPRCGGSGFERVEHNTVRRCGCVAVAAAPQSAAPISQIPRGARDAALELVHVDTPERQRLVASLDDWASVRPPRDLYFHGPTGTGKTYVAVAIARALAPEGFLFALAEDVGDLLRYSSAEKLARVATPELLVLDDLGADKGGAAQRRALTRMIEARHNADLRTITTSNLSYEQLADHFDDYRLMSRLRGSADAYAFSGRDRRVRS